MTRYYLKIFLYKLFSELLKIGFYTFKFNKLFKQFNNNQLNLNLFNNGD